MDRDIAGAGSSTDIAPPTDFAFIGIPLAFRSAFPPFRLSVRWPQQNPTIMRSLLLVLIALPLTSFALTTNRVNIKAEDSACGNGTTPNKFRLQHRHKGNTFFKYAEARLFSLSPVLSYSGSEWNFFSNPDPTHGNVAYQTRENSRDLAYVDGDGSAVLRVDNKGRVPSGGKRRS